MKTQIAVVVGGLAGLATDMIPLLSQPVGRISFAGEFTAENSGTMEGALASGLQAARQIGEVLR